MWHYVVIEIEWQRQYDQAGHTVTEQCWNHLYKVPTYRDDFGEESLCFKGCLAWIENNKVDGSKYAVMKMYLV